jgi:acrylyl-CoA reductase (NADPH)
MIKAFRIFAQNEARLVSMDENELSPGNVTIRVRYSGVNFKDALAGTGKGKILKKFPLNGGIDAAGIVEASEDSNFKVGQEVLVNGTGIGEQMDGGYCEKLRVDASQIVTKPEGLTLQEAMTLGTAGFTAALAVERMITNGQTPEQGPIVVTGASGGVGSFAVQILAALSYKVIAVSGKESAQAYLRTLGASEVVTEDQLGLGTHPLESVKFGGAIDTLGGQFLAQILAHTNLWGNVSSIGLAASADLPTTVMPMILRGVSLLGISSNNTPMKLRQKVWNQLGGAWKPSHLEKVLAKTISLDDLPQAFDDLMNRKITGRIVVVI